MLAFFMKVMQMGNAMLTNPFLRDPQTRNILPVYFEVYDVYADLPSSVQKEFEQLPVMSRNPRTFKYTQTGENLIDALNNVTTPHRRIHPDLFMETAFYYLQLFDLLE